MVHQYKNNGYDIVLDVNSGAIHVVDDVTYDVIEMYAARENAADTSVEEIVTALSGKYGKEEVEEAIDEVQTLIKNEELFTKDTYENYMMDFKKRPTIVYISHMTAILPVVTALQKRASIMEEGH